MGDLTSGPGRKIMTAVSEFNSRTALMKGRVSVQSLLKQVITRGKLWPPKSWMASWVWQVVVT